MDYKITAPDAPQKVLWREDTCVRYSGGFNLDTSNLPAGTKELPKGTLLSLDIPNRTAKAIKGAVTVATVAASATSIQVAKGHLLMVGDTVGVGANTAAVPTIDTSNADYDTVTLAAAIGALAVGDAIAGTETPHGFNYAPKPIEQFTSVTCTIQAYEIQGKNLPYGITEAQKEALTARHHFIN
jgi:hypothetical protein